jgi:hypothetical protein
MKVTNECWHFAQECERWAGEEKDPQVRSAFYSMARGFAQMALQEPTVNEVTGLASSDAEAALTLLALALRSERLSVPVSRLRDGRERPSIADAAAAEPQSPDARGNLAQPLPIATQRVFDAAEKSE